MNGRDLSALVALGATLMRRLLREGMVLRSMIWPALLAGGTLIVTLIVASVLQVSSEVAIPAELDPAVVSEIEANGFVATTVDDPHAAVRAGDVWAGTDGRTVWLSGPSEDATRLEATVRAHAGSAWTPVARPPALPEAQEVEQQGQQTMQVLALLFALYGVVFGVGMVARDRDDGTLEAELSLPIRRWVPGAARWLSGTTVLVVFFAYSVALFDALIGVADSAAMVRHGYAASGAAISIGIAVIGTAGSRQGFSGPLALGLSVVFGLIGLGVAQPDLGQWIPLASVLAGGTGWAPALIATATGFVGAAIFARRSARA